jgi:hypothetical protein
MASTTSVALQYRTIDVLAGTLIPAPAVVFRVWAKAVPFFTKYSLDLEGQMTLYDAPGVPLRVKNMLRASSVAPLVLLNV